MIFIFLFLLFYIIRSESYFNDTYENEYVSQSLDFESAIKRLKNISTASGCVYKEYPVKNNYHEFIRPHRSPPCVNTFINNFVTFKKGILNYLTNTNLYFCKYQCNYPKGEWEITFGKWKEIRGAKPKCDVFEVQCYDILFKQIIFRDIYIQIYKLKEKPVEKVTFLKDDYPVEQIKNIYNVHVIILDAVSHYNLLRGLKNTKKYLEKEYSGVVFKRNNKVGPNSRPNGSAFLLNTRYQDLKDFSSLKEVLPSDFELNGDDGCKSPLDKYPYIAKYYKQLNYTVYNGEDAQETVFTGTECKGFKHQIPHHTLRPYTLRLFHPKYKANGNFMMNHNAKCMKSIEYQFKHLTRFMKTYKDFKQFTTTWITHLSHEYMTGHYEYDGYFKNFFQRNKELFDKSFLIFMSDHGFRLGEYRYTEQGTFEDKNPFLIITVPKNLRNNDSEVISNLKANSNKHTSHFDIYATMLDIATEGSKSKFKNMSSFNLTSIMKSDKIKGVSLLREIVQNRTCYEMGINSEYCLCREEFVTYDQSIIDSIYTDQNVFFYSDIVINTLKNNFLGELKRKLFMGDIQKYCVELRENVDGIFDLEYAYTNDKKIVFHLRMEVLPKGIFEAYFDEYGEISSNTIERIDKYSKYSEACLPTHPQRMFCHCKKRKVIKSNLKHIFFKI
uniref:Sulfatase domain-containing protein n=1 Tax=Parastrongyloides trichosuri TaxID=131310 RepID=A0A0N4ZM64_PARTI